MSISRTKRGAGATVLVVLCLALGSPVGEARSVSPLTAARLVDAPCLASAGEPSRPPADLPLDHWAYPLLERLAARGIVEIDLATRPIARSAVRKALLERRARSHDTLSVGRELSERETWALEKLEDEFIENAVDRPTLARRDGDAVIALGLKLGTEIRHSDVVSAPHESLSIRGGHASLEEMRASADVSYELWGGVGDAVGFWSTATVLMEGQNGPRVTRLSSRAKTWRGFAAAVDEAYFKLERERYSVAAGRRGPAWGAARWGRLLISGTAPTLDGIAADLRVGSLSLYALHAVLEYETIGTEEDLSESDHVFMAAHRAVVDGRWGELGVSEAVVYSATIPEPPYLIPLIPYYLSQHNERENDNVLWSLDVLGRPFRGLDVYGEFLVDDLQYERDTGHPDKYGATIGAAHYGSVSGSDVETRLEYSNVRKWTYTHESIEHRFAQDGRPIGFDLGPDADRVTLEVVYHPSVKWSTRLGLASARKGEGTIADPFHESDNAEPTFPSGDVRTTRRVSLDLLYDDLGVLSGGLGASYRDSEGGGSDDDGWEIWAGARFRI